MTLHRAWLTLHQWVGLTAAPFVFTMALTGSALVFENEIDRALNPTMSYVHPEGAPLPLADLVARVDAARPDDPVRSIRIGEEPEFAYEMSTKTRKSVFVNPYSGAILGSRDREKSLARFIHLLHTRFVAGDIGERVAGWFTVLMLVLAVSGVILWWPRRILTVKSASSWKRTNFDLHNALGFYSSLAMTVIALSAVMIAFEGTTDPLVERLNGGLPKPAVPGSTPIAGAARLTPDEAVRVAGATLPGARATALNVPAGPKIAYMVFEKYPEDRTPAGRSHVYIDQFSGRVLRVDDMRTAPLGTWIIDLKRSAHTGDIFGAPTRALYFLVSLGTAIQAVTGVLIWLNSRKPRLRRR